MKISVEDIRRKESALVTLLNMMDLPSMRIEKKDWRWVSRNLAARNKDHPMYETTRELLLQVLKYG